MQYTMTFYGKLPSLNEYIHAINKSQAIGNSFKKTYQKQLEGCISGRLRGVVITRPIMIHYTYYEAKANRDVDNVAGFFHKVFQDALVHEGVIPNDNQRYIKGFSDVFYLDREEPRVEIIIEEV